MAYELVFMSKQTKIAIVVPNQNRDLN